MQSVTSFKVSVWKRDGNHSNYELHDPVSCMILTGTDLPLADPGFGEPGKIDFLLGAVLTCSLTCFFMVDRMDRISRDTHSFRDYLWMGKYST